uniref:Calmodulin-lysine N-methyltransferase n=1 Tax=Elaeophora elaphi TaxID=1147741 RepID=A0A0R3RUN7_9BILA
MDDVDLDREDGNGKRSVVDGEDLTVVPNKRSKKEKEKSPKAEVSKQEKPLPGAEVSKARQRWNLLSYYLRCNHKRQASDITTDAEATFVVFEAFFIPKLSDTGRWYHLKSPIGDIEFDVHIYSPVIVTPNILIGFNNSGNIRIWPSEECLAYYLLKHEKLVQSKTILELGSGMVGLSGLTSVALGAAEVVLTDGNEKSVENIQRIVETNKLSNLITCSVLPWDVTIPNKKFDAILCADCLFFTEEHPTLLNCIYRHLRPGGIAYVMAPDRGGTVLAFLNLVYEERMRWQSVSVNFHIENEAEICSKLKMRNSNMRSEIPMLLILKKSDLIHQEVVDAIHYSCMLIQDEVVEELEKKGQKMEFDKEVVAQVAFAICDTLCVTWPNDLLQFAKHARRLIVNISDLRLLFRRNENMLSLIGNIAESSSFPARKRQSRKGANKKGSKAIDSSGKMGDENSKDVGTLLSENKDTLKLTDIWDQPSTSRERLSPLFSTSSKYTVATTRGEKILQKEEMVTKKKETLLRCNETPDIIIGSRKTDNRSERQNRRTKEWLHPVSDLNDSESGEKQELEFLAVNVPCYSGKENLQEQKPQSVTSSLSVANPKMHGINELDIPVCITDLSKEVRISGKNPTISTLELYNKTLTEGSTAVVTSRETASHIQANKTDGDKTEFRMGLSNGKSLSSGETSALNSMRIIGKQLMDTSSRNRSSAADDCKCFFSSGSFSSFKFESDDEDLNNSLSLVDDKATNSKKAMSSSTSNERQAFISNLHRMKCFADKHASININQEEHQNTNGEESDIDLDATVFDF